MRRLIRWACIVALILVEVIGVAYGAAGLIDQWRTSRPLGCEGLHTTYAPSAMYFACLQGLDEMFAFRQ